MKTCLLFLSLFISCALSAQTMAAERILISDIKTADVLLNNTSVRCSALGYGLEELKINIPALDGWTLFDHSNINAGDFPGEPCMTAGMCKRAPRKGGFSIEDILGSNDGQRVERLKIRRQIVEIKELGKDENGTDVCHRRIEERLQTEVSKNSDEGQIQFHHVRSGLNETFPARVCQ